MKFMRISLLTIGRLRNACFQEAAADYARRIARYATLEHVELREERAAKGAPVKDLVHREGERLLKAVPKGAFVIALDAGGQTCTSEALAARISELGLQRRSRVAFMVGGAFGLAPEVIRGEPATAAA